jgi:hypothetical protein
MNNLINSDSIIELAEKLEYQDKLKLYNRIFSLGNLTSVDLNTKLILISLIALTYNQLHKKDPQITPLSILMQITGQRKDNSGFYQFLEGLSILVQDISYGCTTFDPCGLQSSQEIINKIKEILTTWVPF